MTRSGGVAAFVTGDLPPLFAAPPPKIAILSGIQADESWMPPVCKRYDQKYASKDSGSAPQRPLEVQEGKARLNRHFLPYNGLGIASDKVLGKLFWGNGWIALHPTGWDFGKLYNKWL